MMQSFQELEKKIGSKRDSAILKVEQGKRATESLKENKGIIGNIIREKEDTRENNKKEEGDESNKNEEGKL